MSGQPRSFRVIFMNHGRLFEIYARSVTQGGLYGFVEVEELLFGTRSSVVVDPGEEQLKHEFAGVRRSYIPIHAIVRIDEVEREGVARIAAGRDADNVRPFPTYPRPEH